MNIPNQTEFLSKEGYERHMNQAEKAYLAQAIELNNGNLSKTAVSIGIDRKTLYNKIKKLDIIVRTIVQ